MKRLYLSNNAPQSKKWQVQPLCRFLRGAWGARKRIDGKLLSAWAAPAAVPAASTQRSSVGLRGSGAWRWPPVTTPGSMRASAAGGLATLSCPHSIYYEEKGKQNKTSKVFKNLSPVNISTCKEAKNTVREKAGFKTRCVKTWKCYVNVC